MFFILLCFSTFFSFYSLFGLLFARLAFLNPSPFFLLYFFFTRRRQAHQA